MTGKILPPNLNRSPIDSIAEREIDLLLVGELHSNPAFLSYVVQAVAEVQSFDFVGAWRGIFDRLGETDIFLLVATPARGRIAVLIENKIDAIFQPMQAERYRQRGAEGVQEGHWDHYITCLFGPQSFVKPHSQTESWDTYLTSEQVVGWIKARADIAVPSFLESALRKSIEKKEPGASLPTPPHRISGGNIWTF